MIKVQFSAAAACTTMLMAAFAPLSSNAQSPNRFADLSVASQYFNSCSFWLDDGKGDFLSDADLKPAFMSMVCLGYASGMIDTLQFQADVMAIVAEQRTPLDLCLPSTASVPQVMRVARKYLREHPEMETYLTNQLVAAAANDAWCQR